MRPQQCGFLKILLTQSGDWVKVGTRHDVVSVDSGVLNPYAGLRTFLFSKPFSRTSKMKLLKIIIRNEKFEEVKESLTAMHVTGMTVTEVRGHGRQKGHKAVYRGTEYSVTLLPKVMIEVILPDELVENVLEASMKAARTGEIGDGRIFVIPVEQGYNIRTGERDIV
jgi:nitrogen regulatory protein PII